jgi:hypothetical protein
MKKTLTTFLIFCSFFPFSACKNDYTNLPDPGGVTLDTFDLNHNGLFESNELTLVCNSTGSGPARITQEQLAKADKNKDGYITIDEMEVLFYSTAGWTPCKK